MKCPKCNNDLVALPWEDGGGYIGLKCRTCWIEWHSDSFATELGLKVYEATKKLEEEALQAEFPKDAMSNEEWHAFILKGYKESEEND